MVDIAVTYNLLARTKSRDVPLLQGGWEMLSQWMTRRKRNGHGGDLARLGHPSARWQETLESRECHPESREGHLESREGQT